MRKYFSVSGKTDLITFYSVKINKIRACMLSVFIVIEEIILALEVL